MGSKRAGGGVFTLTYTLTYTMTFTLTFTFHLQIDGASSRSIERHFSQSIEITKMKQFE